MFTGIITHIGTVIESNMRGDLRLRIASAIPAASLTLGESISCSGACLTVVAFDAYEAGSVFDVELSQETINCTVPNRWTVGERLNLERALMMGERLGGHLVTGHVDGLARIESITPAGDSHVLSLRAPTHLSRYIAARGSVTLDGVSLTVNAVEGDIFTVNLIPHTWRHTTFQHRETGDDVHLEIDVIARYVERLLDKSSQQ